MERTVKVSAGVGHHLDARNLKLSSFVIKLLRCFTTQIITNEWWRQSLVCDQTIFNGVTQIDEEILCLFVDGNSFVLLGKYDLVLIFTRPTISRRISFTI